MANLFTSTFNKIRGDLAAQKKVIAPDVQANTPSPPVSPIGPMQGPQQQPNAPQVLTSGGFSGVRPPAAAPPAPEPTPLAPPPVKAAGGPAPSPIFRGTGNELFFRQGGEFKKIANPTELQDLARRGVIQVGQPEQQLPAGALGAPPPSAGLAPPETPTVAPPGVPSAGLAPTPQPTQTPAEIQRDALRKQLSGFQQPGEEEAAIQQEITTLLNQGAISEAQAREAAAALSGQGRGITLDIITGQQGALTRAGALERQTKATEALPLEQKLANLIARRGQQESATLTQLGFAREDITAQRGTAETEASQLQALALSAAQSGASQQEIASILGAGGFSEALQIAAPFLTPAQEQQALETLSPGQTLFDPNTGEAIFTAPGGKGTGDSGSEVISDTLAEKLGLPFGSTRAEANQIISQQGSEDQKIASGRILELEDKLSLINTIETSEGIDAIVGPNPLARSKLLSPVSSFISGTTADFAAAVSSLIDKDSIGALLNIKSQGATFGQLSDKELAVLRNSSSKINEWVKRNKDNKIVGITVSEKLFLEEVARIKNAATVLKGELDSILSQGGDGGDNIAPNEMDQLRQLFPDLSDEQIREQAGGQAFNQDTSKSLKGVEKLTNGSATLNSLGNGTVTGIDGSSAWKWGLDFVLAGGKGATVKSPISGTVIASRFNGGFGNQVKIRTAQGNELWVSHLDSFNVKQGQKIVKGQSLGTQGNTGKVLSSSGGELTDAQRASGRGTHLDLTIKKPDGSFFTSREVAGLLGDSRLA